MLDMWHNLLSVTPWRDILPETEIPGVVTLPDGWTVETFLLAVVGIPLALLVLHFVRVILITVSGRKYRALRALNQACAFDRGIRERYEYKVNLTSRKQLERYDFERFFLDEYTRNPQAFGAVLESALNNEKKYRKYKADVEQLLGVKPGEAAKVRFFDPLEVKICKRHLLKPVPPPIFHCTAEYVSPKGKTSSTRTADFNVKQMEAIGKQYKRNVDFQASKAYQRSLMTDSMRYDIMKRDNFRCVLCGRTAKEGVKLHVDHILPVAKGGKTVPENLRTLCDQCNLGKSDKYDPKGVN